MYTNKQVVISFCKQKKCKNRNLSTDGKILWSYATPIAIWDLGKPIIYITETKYSRTTSRHQNLVKRYADNYEIVTGMDFSRILDIIKRGAYSAPSIERIFDIK